MPEHPKVLLFARDPQTVEEVRPALNGAVFRQAADVESARRLFHEDTPDVVVLDTQAASEWMGEVAAQESSPPVIVFGAVEQPDAFASVASAADLPAWLAAAARYRWLQQKYEALIRDLQRSNNQLIQQEKMAALGALVAGIAHDMHTPIGTITSNSDILSRSLARLRDLISSDCCPDSFRKNPDVVRVVNIVEEISKVNQLASDRIVGIVRSLRNFARLDEAEVRKADIHEALESTLTLIHHELKSRITVIREYGDIPQIDCHPNQLNQVFMNILVNAAHAIRGSGAITIRTFREGGSVKVQISDTGSGIPPDVLPKIFDPGFTTKGVGVGTGLGLAICYKIVQDHKGRIDVETEVGRGTTFTITLPIEWKTSTQRQ
jgi:two-component system NtrC family sensor kinase